MVTSSSRHRLPIFTDLRTDGNDDWVKTGVLPLPPLCWIWACAMRAGAESGCIGELKAQVGVCRKARAAERGERLRSNPEPARFRILILLDWTVDHQRP